MRRPRRISAARYVAWREALAFLGRSWRLLLSLGLLLGVAVALVNLWPGAPSWERGLVTGVLLTTFFGMVFWTAWVPSGLANRSMGAVAEGWVREELQGCPGVFWTLPSWKYDSADIDVVALAKGTSSPSR